MVCDMRYKRCIVCHATFILYACAFGCAISRCQEISIQAGLSGNYTRRQHSEHWKALVECYLAIGFCRLGHST